MRAAALVIASLISMSAQAQEPVRLYAAGSLRLALTEVGKSFQAATGTPVAPTFGASGLLRERIEKGEPAEVFASADMGHPQRLAAAGRAGEARLFTRNRLCALAAPGVSVSSETLLERMLDPKVKLGTSTPKADPSGDYAWELFEKAERVRPASREVLSNKALKLVGAPDSPQAPAGRSVYAMLVSEGKADIFLTYCTNAIAAHAENGALRIVQIPPALGVGAEYGLTVLKGARTEAESLARYILSAPAQAILSKYGFSPGETR
jgi:molybdate transport system substrate-binding protein